MERGIMVFGITDSCFATLTVGGDSVRADSVMADSCFETQTVRADSC